MRKRSESASQTAQRALGTLLLTGILCVATGPAGPILPSLGTAAAFNVLAANSITSFSSFVRSNVGLYEADSSSLLFTEFQDISIAFVKDSTGKFGTQFTSATCFSMDLTNPTPAILDAAASDFAAAFDNATGQTQSRITNLGNGQIGGQALAPGLYHWTGNVVATSNFNASGGPSDTWIFQIDGDLTIGPNVNFIGKGGATPQNILWAVSGDVNIGTRAIFQGILLSENDITFGNSSQHLGPIFSMNSVTFNFGAFFNGVIM